MEGLEHWARRTLAARGIDAAALAAAVAADEASWAAWQHEGRSLPHEDLLALVDALSLRGAADDAPPWWDEAVRLKDEMSLKELADHLGVPVTTLTTELRKRGVRRRIRLEEDEESLPPEAGDGGKPDRRPGSKDMSVEQYYHLLGKVPDSEVARLAGVSVRTIASYRARNEIIGYAGPRRRPAPRGRRQSKVDDFSQLLGKVPDRVIADVAGMSLGAVRNYRIKHDIPAAGRMPREEIDRLIETWRHGGAEPGPSTGSSWTPAPVAAARTGTGTGTRDGQPTAWRCRLHGDDEGFIVVADSLRSAVERAVSAAGDERRIAAFEQLGHVLDLG